MDDAALQLSYAAKVVIVPGYGLAAAQAQHEVVELAQALTNHGIEVSYGIHPVAGRMPGQMNVLLAEANASYDQLKDLDEINPQFANTGRGARGRRQRRHQSRRPPARQRRLRNAHPRRRQGAQRHRDQALPRPRYAGIDNELTPNPRTAMLFSDAKRGLSALLAGL